MKKQGVLLCNLGTPDAPTAKAVCAYLAQFLRDQRVVSIPKPIWLPILYSAILPFRPQKVAKLYQKIWTKEGSPLLAISQRQRTLLQNALNNKFDTHIPVELGMAYGRPSIDKGLQALKNQGCERIIVLPLYPQYCSATTAAIFDQINHHYQKEYSIPELSFVQDYFDNKLYIKALSTSVKAFWNEHKPAEKLLLSFHGVPQRFSQKGDPYEAQCRATAQALAQELDLSAEQIVLSFQSQFGKEKWLEPSTSATLESFAAQGIRSVQVLCPAFSADCLETLEEIALENKAVFEKAGGEEYDYIPALNDNSDHIQMMLALVDERLQ